MSAPATVAVVVPVHNAADYLPACLDAISAQTHSDFCCILVDDGSTDASPALCEDAARADSRFRVLHQRQAGVSAARAAGVRAGQQTDARWFAFCDADDLYHPAFLQTLLEAAHTTGQPVACCRYDSFADTPPADAAPAAAPRVLAAPAHLDALLHDHRVDFSLCNKLYAREALDPAFLDNDFSYNEDLLANWQVFSGISGIAFVDFAGYHYRQHAQSASHRPLTPASIDEQRRAALFIREHAGPEMQQSADAFYYEKLVYLASMILRRDNAADYRVQLNELGVGITSGLKDRNLGRNPRLPLSIRLSAVATAKFPALWQKFCRRYLRDRQ